jgi:hypothetical protein
MMILLMMDFFDGGRIGDRSEHVVCLVAKLGKSARNIT